MGYIGMGIIWAIINTTPIIIQTPTMIGVSSQPVGPEFIAQVKRHIVCCKASKVVKFEVSDGFIGYRRQISHRVPTGIYTVKATDLNTNAESIKVIEIKD